MAEVEVVKQAGTMTLTLNRPHKLNAFTAQMRDELLAAFDEADQDDAVRVIVITGAGRSFCAGADLTSDEAAFSSTPNAGQREVAMLDGVPEDRGGQLTLRLAELGKPVIAAVNGAAVGVGVTMTLAMDFRIASAQARFGFVFTRRGLVPESAATWYLPRIVGLPTALEWCLPGRLIGAEEALRAGLVSRVVDGPELLPAAYQLADEIIRFTSPLAVAMTRRMLWASLGSATPADSHRLTSLVNHQLKLGPDVTEGVAAFIEKREPRFSSSVRAGSFEALPAWPGRPSQAGD